MKRKIPILRLLGFALIAAGVCLLLFSRLYSRSAARRSAETCQTIEALLPPRTPGIPGTHTETEMPSLEIGGEDYLAVVEIPAFGVKLPVGSRWSRMALLRHPCRFHGSVQDSSLVLGGACQAGQFDFCEALEIGDLILVTDMNGAQFRYRVSHIGRNSKAETDWLCREEYDLTLFARTEYSLEYIAVRCKLSPN